MLSKNMLYRSSNLLIFTFSLFLFLLFDSKTNAEIYKYVDKEGVVHYTDRPKNSNYKLLQIFNKFSYKKSTPTTYIDSGDLKDIIDDVAKRYGQDPSLIQSIINTESNFNPNAVSPKGAMGLMQLMPGTARRFKVKDPFHPKQNIEGGVAYLDYLMKLFNNDIELALAAYNVGENKVIDYSGIPPYKETKDYVRKVLGSYKVRKVEKINKIYKIIREDGSILLTTNPESLQ